MAGRMDLGLGFGRKLDLDGGPSPEARSFGEGRPCIVDQIRAVAEPLPEVGDTRFAEAFGRFAEAKVVLLGEASHGTSEFYRARAAITQRLVERHGFNIVALEA